MLAVTQGTSEIFGTRGQCEHSTSRHDSKNLRSLPAIRIRGSRPPTRTPAMRPPPGAIVHPAAVRRSPASVTGSRRRAPCHRAGVCNVRAVPREVPVSIADVALVVAGGTGGEMFARSTSPLYSHSFSWGDFNQYSVMLMVQ
jgi:hypothetical protein